MKQDFLFVDFETKSKIDLAKKAQVNYSHDCQVIIISYCFLSKIDIQNLISEKLKPENVFKKIQVRTNVNSFKDLPKEIQNFRGQILCFNWSFEYSIFKNCLKANSFFCNSDNYLDVMQICNRYSLTSGLDSLTEFLKEFLPENFNKKLVEGKNLIKEFSIPDKKTGEIKELSKENLESFVHYARHDVMLTILIFSIFFDFWNKEEKEEIELYKLDRKINSNGFDIDFKSAQKLQKVYEFYQNIFFEKSKVFGYDEKKDVLAISSSHQFKELLNSILEKLNIEKIDSVEREVLEKIQNQLQEKLLGRKEKVFKLQTEKENLIDKLLVMIELRFFIQAKSPKKLEAFLDLSRDSKIHFSLNYHYAHTGRWASKGVQIQNMPRKSVKEKEYLKELKKFCEVLKK